MMKLVTNREPRLIIILAFGAVFYYIHSSSRLSISEDQHQSMQTVPKCSDDSLALPGRSESDGHVVRSNLEPSEWPPYFSDSVNETDRRIFFHETGGRAQLGLQECCAVESAAHHNPDRPIRLFVRPPTNNCNTIDSSLFASQPCFSVLNRYPNVAVILVNEDHYFAGSRFEEWYRKGEWRQSRFEVAHLSDYLRILTLSKGGGFYLDLDMITLNTFKGRKFHNFFVYGDSFTGEMSNTVMHLERGHWLIDEIIQPMASDYDPGSYTFHGPEVITQVMHRLCNPLTSDPVKLATCRKTIRVLSDQWFYPIPSILYGELFLDHGNETQTQLTKLKSSVAIHIWNSVAKYNRLNVGSNQLLAILFRQHCPITASRARQFE